MQLLAVPIGAAGGVVDDKATVLVPGRLTASLLAVVPHPAEGHPQPGQQLVHREGLGQIVIRPGVQRRHLVPVIGPGRYHDDGHIAPGADLLDDLDAVDIGQTQVQQHHVRTVGQGVHDCLRAVFGPVELVVLRLQCRGDQIAHGGVILHKQNLRFIHMALPPMPAG